MIGLKTGKNGRREVREDNSRGFGVVNPIPDEIGIFVPNRICKGCSKECKEIDKDKNPSQDYCQGCDRTDCQGCGYNLNNKLK